MRFSLLLIACAAITGCHTTHHTGEADRSNLTAGMTKKTVVKGQTTQAEILEVFGPPDLVTHRDNIQIWTYDKTRYDVQASSGYLTVLLAGTTSERVTSSSVSTMLIVYFDGKDVVTDYRLNTYKF